MSSVIVIGMKMPENCIKCPLQFGGWCYASPPEIDERVAPTVDEAWEQGKPDWCPLVALPDHHGRLVDADALEKAVAGMVPYAIDDASSSAYTDGIGAAYYLISDAPTIVESEGENADHN